MINHSEKYSYPRITGGRDKRKCEHYNTIPHETPSNTNRRDWHNAYISQLKDIHAIIANTMNERHKNNIKWAHNQEITHNMSRLIYHCSSKNISKYIDLPWETSDEKEFKDLKS